MSRGKRFESARRLSLLPAKPVKAKSPRCSCRGFSIGRVAKSPCLEVREALEHRRPVLADLLFATEAPLGVCRLFASIVQIEAPHQRFEVMAIERLGHPFDYHGPIFLPPFIGLTGLYYASAHFHPPWPDAPSIGLAHSASFEEHLPSSQSREWVQYSRETNRRQRRFIPLSRGRKDLYASVTSR